MRIMKLLCMAVTLCAFGQANAANYYMSPGGSDGNDGSAPGRAWATLQHARSHGLAPGDTLFIMGGTYANAQYFHDETGAINGTAGRPVVFKAYGDAVAIFQSTGPYPDSYYRSYFLWDGNFDTQYITIDGFGYRNNQPYYLKLEGHENASNLISFETQNLVNHSRHMTVRGVEVDGSPSGGYLYHGIKLTNSDYFDIDHCYVHHAYHATGTIAPGDGSDFYQETGECMFIKSCEFGKIRNSTFKYGNHGLIAMERLIMESPPHGHETRYCQVTNNLFENHWGGGLFMNRNTHHVLLDGNIFAHCGETSAYGKPPIQLSGYNNTIRRNVFFNPGNQGMVMNAQTSFDGIDHYIVNNNLIYNNTYFRDRWYDLGLYVSNASSADCSCENNGINNNIFLKANGPWNSECPGSFKCEIRADTYASNSTHNWIQPDGQRLSPATTAWGGNTFRNNCMRYNSEGVSNDSLFIFGKDADEGGGCYTYSATEMEVDGSGAWANNIGNDPLLVSEDPDAYGLTNKWWYFRNGSSPCVDAGAVINDYNGAWVEANYPGYGWGNLSYSGNAPDIGAYEYGGENPVPPLPPVLGVHPGRK